ncbi:hypothetical protein GPZ77_30570 [Streptomyces sp. QHH-9511]|uniref:DUF6197 family protein n=1 Tax=Streptomyces sp. QHH-9511 TaxID=2684468 RepID=UPI001317ED37|nr:hypothetical protein [Streptomyces sp. QHH-9511]QGZ52132.1 hypothetical protein GPZ77_30570 [Streptomyces sp. QHH-9511]
METVAPHPAFETVPDTAPEVVDRAAARLYDTAAWQEIVRRWDTTAPAPGPAPGPAPAPEEWRRLLSVPVDELVATALGALPAPPPVERPLPGRLGAILPDRLHAWRRIGQPDLRPSAHLAHARRVLVEWGWQNQPYRLRDARGARCLCGALLTAHRLGHGSAETMNRSAAWIVTELRAQGWTGLIGPWNRAPGRTAEQALALIDATIRRAAHAGE